MISIDDLHEFLLKKGCRIWNNNTKKYEVYDSLEIELFTGIIDCNGNKVYENDIVEFECKLSNGSKIEKGIINMDEVYVGVDLLCKGKDCYPRILDKNKYIRVIGNIKENKKEN